MTEGGRKVPGVDGEPPQWWPRSGWGTVRDYMVLPNEHGGTDVAFSFVPDDGSEAVPVVLNDASPVSELGEYARGIMRNGNLTIKVSAAAMAEAEAAFQRINRLDRDERALMFADRSDIDGDCGWTWAPDYILVKIAPGIIN